MSDKETTYFVFDYLKKNYGPCSDLCWPTCYQPAKKISLKKALELANSLIECSRIFETLKLDSPREWNYLDFKYFITNCLNNPDVFAHFNEMKASVCNESFLDDDASKIVIPAIVLPDMERNPEKTTTFTFFLLDKDASTIVKPERPPRSTIRNTEKITTFEVFKNNISFLQDAHLLWEEKEHIAYHSRYSEIIYSAIFYIIEYYTKGNSFFFSEYSYLSNTVYEHTY